MRVRVVESDNNTALIEWIEEGKLYRSIMPLSEVEIDVNNPKTAHVEHPEQGIEYGLDFTQFFKVPQLTPEQFDQALKKSGIWTAEDVNNKPQVVLGALQKVYGWDLSRLRMTLAKRLGGLK